MTTMYPESTSKIVQSCQICQNNKLESVLFLGYLPPVNTMPLIDSPPQEQPSYPAELLYCSECHLTQLGCIVDQKILFPPEYPYTSSTTKVLRENFSELYQEVTSLIPLDKNDLVVDIGSNDGNLLSNFQKNHRVLGVTPEAIGKIAVERGIPTLFRYFNEQTASEILNKEGKSKVITATNVFAHIDDVHGILKGILSLLDERGIFISESHYLLPLIQTLQYDTIYHEHLRYYSLSSLTFLMQRHGLEVFHAKKIPTHGGSIRVYAARKGHYEIKSSVSKLLAEEKPVVTNRIALQKFSKQVVQSKLELHALLLDLVKGGQSIYGVSAPSRGSTLVSYVGLDNGILECIVEVKGSHKIGKYMPGTRIPVLDEEILYQKQPEYALLLSWHIADELAVNLRKRGFRGKFIVPLPVPRVLDV